MRKKVWIWTALSSFLWLLLASFTTIFLIRQLALSTLTELKSNINSEQSFRTKIDLKNIKNWLAIAAFFNSYGIAEEPRKLSDFLNLLEPLLAFNSMPNFDQLTVCPHCTAPMQEAISESNRILISLQKNLELHSRLEDLQQMYIKNQQEVIGRHVLLADDFADLLGSTAYYQSKGRDALAFYSEGTFQWLPKLDDEAGSRTADANPVVVEGFSEKLEKLRAQSKVIVQEYEEIQKKNQENTKAITTTNEEIKENYLLLKAALLDGLQSEVEISLDFFHVPPWLHT